MNTIHRQQFRTARLGREWLSVLAVVFLLAFLLSYSIKSFAQTNDSSEAAAKVASAKPLSCETLKKTIEDKLESKAVKNYKLEIIDATESSTAKIVGQCDGGKHKIAYTKDR